MVTLNTSTLTGLPLDFAVAEIQGYTFVTDGVTHRVRRGDETLILGPSLPEPSFSPSTLEHQAGELIEREGMEISPPERRDNGRGTVLSITYWTAEIRDVMSAMGATRAEAAARCFVFARRGATVDVPDALL